MHLWLITTESPSDKASMTLHSLLQQVGEGGVWRCDSGAGHAEWGQLQGFDAHHAAVTGQPDSLDLRHTGRRWDIRVCSAIVDWSKQSEKNPLETNAWWSTMRSKIIFLQYFCLVFWSNKTHFFKLRLTDAGRYRNKATHPCNPTCCILEKKKDRCRKTTN